MVKESLRDRDSDVIKARISPYYYYKPNLTYTSRIKILAWSNHNNFLFFTDGMTVEKDEESHKMKPNPLLTLKYSVLLTTALLILSLCMLILPSKRQSQFLSQPVTYWQNLEYYDIDEVFDPHLNEDIMDKEENELDGCYHVYLDVGSNVGNQVNLKKFQKSNWQHWLKVFFFSKKKKILSQIRKLYEPDLFVNATVLPIFDKYFGDPGVRQEKGTVCAIGFEPNSHHTSILQKIQSAYNLCDWKVKLFTETAAAHSYGLATYYSDHNSDWREWGGSIVHSKIAKHPAGVAK